MMDPMMDEGITFLLLRSIDGQFATKMEIDFGLSVPKTMKRYNLENYGS